MDYLNNLISQWRKFYSRVKLERLTIVLLTVLMLPFFINAQHLISDNKSKRELLRPTIRYSKINNETTRVNYNFQNTRKVNPYNVSYDYVITHSDKGEFIELKSFLNDLDLRFEKNVKLNFEGEEVFYPSNLVEGMKLENVNGKFTISIPHIESKVFYDVKMKNREVIRKEEITLNSEMHTAFVIVYEFELEKYAGDEVLSKTNEKITDWFVSDFGNVERQRTGTLTSRNGDVIIDKSISKIILK